MDIFFRIFQGISEMPNIHPLIVHFPIALLDSFLLMELLSFFTGRESFRFAADWMLYLGTAGALGAVLAGLWAATTVEHSEEAHAVLLTHRDLGLTVLALSLFLSAWRIYSRGRFSRKGKTLLAQKYDYYKAEYIWIDGQKPTAKLRSKTKVLNGPVTSLDQIPDWGFDGSSTSQAEGHFSDLVLKPVKFIPDPIHRDGDILVLCEVLHPDHTTHWSNTRRRLATERSLSAGPTMVSPRRNSATTAASAPTKCSAARSSKRIVKRASAPDCRSKEPMPR